MDFRTSRQNRFFIFIAILLPVIYGFFFIRNFSLPLTGGGDIDEWEYVGFYLAENLHFDIFPQVALQQNQTFYPFGTTQAFSDWSLESNYWFAFFYKIFGHGAWLNYYYVLSLIISFLGSYILLKKEFGQNKAFFAGFVVTFFNFYALNKYPHHFNHSTIHWTILSIFSDFILTKRFILREVVSIKWVFLKAFLLIATLGMNLGYICGFALTSFVLSLAVVTTVIINRYFKKEYQLLDYVRLWRNESKGKFWQNIVLAMAPLILLYFYLPVVLQIYQESQSLHFNNGQSPHLWSHPLRILFPYMPFFNASENPLTNILKDMPEGLGSGSPGWFCLGLGITGYFYNRKKYWLVFLPLVILLVISTFYHPNKVPTLKIFPWGTFNRVPSRFTSVLPVIFCCFILPLEWNRIKMHKILIGLLILFLLIEGTVVYRFLYSKETYRIDKSFFNYMSLVESQKGEAVLDFPFCIVGGDGTGLKENLCPIFDKTCNVYALRRFHHKKVVGGYYSHIHLSAIKGFVDTGLGALAEADSKDWRNASRIVNEFSDEQLEYFIKYFQFNDFAGINLCVDLIPEKMYKQIVKSIGTPIQTTVFPGAGKVVFIPKPLSWRVHLDKNKALKIKFPCGC
ncbi:hypothetical protein [Emticicia sp. BO119]|uniref:hypothetical protein n=1 Tax=Emticicia sp. BO119 TaxID=2757768 RepID=UPI0015EFEA06|nr:hypothetical protein [Emticicia sp. BO119]MBA4850144.1 hypothetical protein [Emticicia sp. BO119]